MLCPGQVRLDGCLHRLIRREFRPDDQETEEKVASGSSSKYLDHINTPKNWGNLDKNLLPRPCTFEVKIKFPVLASGLANIQHMGKLRLLVPLRVRVCLDWKTVIIDEIHS